MEMLMKSYVLPGQLLFLSYHTQAWPAPCTMTQGKKKLQEGVSFKRQHFSFLRIWLRPSHAGSCDPPCTALLGRATGTNVPTLQIGKPRPRQEAALQNPREQVKGLPSPARLPDWDPMAPDLSLEGEGGRGKGCLSEARQGCGVCV